MQKWALTHEEQKGLFYIAFDAIAADAERIATKDDVTETYGETDWNNLNDAIRDVVIDLRFRGDYTPKTRRKIQSAIAANDLELFTALMSDKNYWLNNIKVPKDRFERRKNFLKKALQ
jgi:Trm5-related predicted tRNA methylase